MKSKFYNRIFGFVFTAILLITVNYSCVDFLLKEDPHDASFRNSETIRSAAPLQFFILSDYGFSGNEKQKNVAEAMNKLATKTRLDFILTCGDNFQYAGVKDIHDSLWFFNFENVYNFESLNVTWYPALGNHDYMSNPDALVEYSTVNPRWVMPARYYFFTKKISTQNSILFIALDTYNLITEISEMDPDSGFLSVKQFRWLDEVLDNNKEKWVVVYGHHPVFSSGWHGDTPELKQYLKPLLDKYKVDFYICGHDHQFEHIQPYNTFTDFFITGVGGSPRSSGKSKNTVFVSSSAGFTFIRAFNNNLSLYFVNDSGSFIYYYDKVKISPVNHR